MTVLTQGNESYEFLLSEANGMRSRSQVTVTIAGGVALPNEEGGVDESLMLRALPGVYCAGEMLDWEAPTGGYLLSACLASGSVAGQGATRLLAKPL